MMAPEASAMTGAQLSVIGAGRVGQTLAHLLRQHLGLDVTHVLCRDEAHAVQAANFIGAGKPVDQWEQLGPSGIWLIGVPDSAIAQSAELLARRAVSQGWSPAKAFHCSGFCTSEELAPLKKLGWSVASVHPALNFANPCDSVRQFKGTFCGVEGDVEMKEWLLAAMQAIGGEVFALQADTKKLYHAAAVFCSNFTIALQDIAQQAWRAASVPESVIAPLNKQLLEVSVRNALALGPASAITGPAARGDAKVVQQQWEAVSLWNADAGDIYRQLSEAAYRLALAGGALSPTPHRLIDKG